MSNAQEDGRNAPRAEVFTPERCHILELSNTPDDPDVSIARARVEPGVTTGWHRVVGTAERYVILEGTGRVEVGDLPAQDVTTGDVVLIPPSCRQRITNTDATDLVFLCVCTPRFRQENYEDLEGDPRRRDVPAGDRRDPIRIVLPPDAAAAVARRIGEASGRVGELARRFDALPLYEDMGGAILLRRDGEVVALDHDDEASTAAEPWITIARVVGAEKYPELACLVPRRPDGATDCTHCGGAGSWWIGATKLGCGICHRLGWIASSDGPQCPGRGES